MLIRKIINLFRHITLPDQPPASAYHRLNYEEVRNLSEYHAYVERAEADLVAGAVFERGLLDGEETFHLGAYCYVCQSQKRLLVDYQYCYETAEGRIPNWRERLVCETCGLNNRLRATAQFIQENHFLSADSKIYMTEQVTQLYRLISEKYPLTVGSEFVADDLASGFVNSAGIRHEDTTKLSFGDKSLDLILSFDVLEHIPDYRAALTECHRVLVEGGSLLFSVPFIIVHQDNVVRARLDSEGHITHLMEPEYHGDPINEDGCLCFYHFGWELLDELRELGFRDAKAVLYWSKNLGYLGGSQILLVARK